MVAEISEHQNVVTLINVFRVRPERRDALLRLLIEATERTMKDRPGYVSANLHVSLDGTRVANYAQWRSVEDFRAMLDDPEAQRHMAAAAETAEPDPVLYNVAYTHHADR